MRIQKRSLLPQILNKAMGDALLNFAKEADAFVKANKDFKPQGEDLKKIQEAEAKMG